MAAGGPLKALCDEASCPICLDYFKDPVTITECGHNFCHTCITNCWGESESDVSCPQCGETVQGRSLKPNRQLANVVELVKKLQESQVPEGGKGAEGKGRVCEKHQEPLKLFCKDHETPICVVCDRSQVHENLKVIPLEEAFQAYKERILGSLEVLRKEREKLLSYQTDSAEEKQELLKQTESERQKTVAVFRELHQFLEEEEKLLLAQVDEVEKEIAACGEKHLAILSEELSSLERLIQEMEEKYQQPQNELLQDIRSTLEKCQEKEPFKSPGPFPPALKWKVWKLRDRTPFLEGVMKKFKANVTLDGNTASPALTISEDHRSVKWEEKRQDLPDNPERFDKWPYVLGCEGFTTGRHCWEVLFGTEENWSVGVARKSMKRKGEFNYSPEEGIWEMGHWASEYRAFGHSGDFSLSLNRNPKRVRVTLSYEGGKVAFFDADTAAQIYTYSGVSFGGEILLPFFFLCGNGHLTLCP